MGEEWQGISPDRDLVPRTKDSEIFSIENAGHSMMIEQPWEYDTICIRFLTKLGLFPGVSGHGG